MEGLTFNVMLPMSRPAGLPQVGDEVGAVEVDDQLPLIELMGPLPVNSPAL